MTFKFLFKKLKFCKSGIIHIDIRINTLYNNTRTKEVKQDANDTKGHDKASES